jgi:two-component system, cell cycle response regulator DivK
MTPPRSVLVVDDYADTREMLSMALELAGYGVLLAESGQDALDLARRHHPAAVVMDIYMPEMDGIETTRRLRAEPDLANIPVVAHTARPQRLVALEQLFDGICGKPCPPDQLIHVLDEVLRSTGSSGADD